MSATTTVPFYTNDIKIKLTNCNVVTITAPPILAVSAGFDYVDLMTHLNPYVLPTNFVTSSINCPLTQVWIEPSSVGSAADLLSTDGVSSVTLLTSHIDPNIWL